MATILCQSSGLFLLTSYNTKGLNFTTYFYKNIFFCRHFLIGINVNISTNSCLDGIRFVIFSCTMTKHIEFLLGVPTYIL